MTLDEWFKSVCETKGYSGSLSVYMSKNARFEAILSEAGVVVVHGYGNTSAEAIAAAIAEWEKR